MLKPSLRSEPARGNGMLGIRQQQILNLLAARGDLCVEIVLQEQAAIDDVVN